MALTYLEQQKQYTEFLNELDALFRKHNIEHVYVNDSTICLSRSAYDTWTFGSWIMRNDGTRRYTRPGITEYILDSVETANSITETHTETAPTESDTEVSAIVEPLVDEPQTQSEPVENTVTVSDTTISETVETWDTAKQEQVEQEINPKINEYINDLADKLYAEAKARNFPKNTLGEYWTHPAVVRAVKQSGFNESAYLIISANTTYWHMLAERMKEVEQFDKESIVTKPETAEQPVKTEPVVIEKVEPIESYSTDSPFGTWTVKYSDYPESVYLDSKKGRDSICSKAYNWLLIYTRIHPELSPFPTRAMLNEALSSNMQKKQSFNYKWYEFVIEVTYDIPIANE